MWPHPIPGLGLVKSNNKGKTLEDIYFEIGKSDGFEDGEHDDAVIYSIITYLEKMLKQAKNLKPVSEIAIDRTSNKYNL